MKRVGEDGEYQDVDPGLIARYDQMEARFHEITRKILELRDQIKGAVLADDREKVRSLTADLQAYVQGEFVEASASEINYIMFLADLIEQAQVWTSHVFDTTDALIRQLGALASPEHPIKTLPGFSHEALGEELAAVLDVLQPAQGAGEPAADENVFVTDTGVRVLNIHPREACQEKFCVVHRPVPGPWDNWDTHWREDWHLMVRICPHNAAHVAMEEMLRMPLLGMISHDHPAGCDCACDLSRCTPITDHAGAITGFRAGT